MAAKVFTIGGAAISYGGYHLRDTGNGSLTISKTVSGSGFDPAKTFGLTVTFSVPVTYNGTTSATHTFNLAHGQSVTITDIPELTSYTVTETPLTPQDIEAGYSISGMTGGSGVVGNGTAATAIASNSFTEPPHPTFRFRFSDGSYDPTVSFVVYQYGQCSYTWTRVSSSPNVWDCRLDRRTPTSLRDYVTSAFESSNSRHFSTYPSDQTIVLVDADLSGYTEGVEYLFHDCAQLSAVESLRGTSEVTAFSYAFAGTGITSCAVFDTSGCEDFDLMFAYCRNLVSAPLLNTSAGTDFAGMFVNCDSLRAVPRLNMPNAEDVKAMFSGCTSVASGALALYQDLAALPALSATSVHESCFYKCGSNSATGAIELAQIPSDWKS